MKRRSKIFLSLGVIVFLVGLASFIPYATNISSTIWQVIMLSSIPTGASVDSTILQIIPAAGSGIVTSVTGTPPITSTLGTTPAIGLTLTQQAYDNSASNAASTAMVQAAANLTMASVPLNIAGSGGTYSFAGLETVPAVISYVVSGSPTPGPITSISSVTTPGTGWAVGDLFTINAGNHDAVLRVATISGSGIATVAILYGGTGYITSISGAS